MSDAQQIAERLADVMCRAPLPSGKVTYPAIRQINAQALLDAGLREAVELLEEMQSRMICRGYCADDSAKALAALKGEKA